MKKASFIIIFLICVSCQKDTVFPNEYELIVGKWELLSFKETDSGGSSYGVLPANALHHQINVHVDKNKILIFSENTLVKKICFINEIEVSTSVYSGIEYKFFRISYRNECGELKEILFSYSVDLDLLQLYYSVRKQNGSEPHYEFIFKRV
jgi:hypothetical protein